MKVDAISVIQVVGLACAGYIISLLVGLPLYHAIASVICLCFLVLSNVWVHHLSSNHLMSTMTQEFGKLLREAIDDFGGLLHGASKKSKKSILKSHIVCWNDTAPDGSLLHPFQKEIDKCVIGNGSVAGRQRYPGLGQTLYMTANDIGEQGLVVGTFEQDPADGLLYPVFPSKEEVSDLVGTVENYFFDLQKGDEFIMLVYLSDITKYCLLKLPADTNKKPFKYEVLN